MTAEHHPSLDWLQVQGAVGVARGRFKELKARYRELSPYLVFSSRLGQVDIDASPAAILCGFSSMAEDNAKKDESLRLISACEELKRRRDAEGMGRSSGSASSRPRRSIEDEIKTMEGRMATALDGLRYHADVRIEIRLGVLVYDRIWELKREPAVDQELTLSTRASIRVVMGTLGRLCEESAGV